jgi:hypothetical protein
MVFDRVDKIKSLLETATALQTTQSNRLETIGRLRDLLDIGRDLDLLERVFYHQGTSLAIQELILKVMEDFGDDRAFNILMRVALNTSLDAGVRFQAHQALKAIQPAMNFEVTPHTIAATRPKRTLLLREVKPDEVYDPSDPRCADEAYQTMITTLTNVLLRRESA